jgi:hypothetical protein
MEPGSAAKGEHIERMNMTKKKKPKEVKVKIAAKVHEKGTLFFRLAVGTATTGEGKDKRKYEMSLNMGGNHPIIRLSDGRWVTFSWNALLNAAERAGKKGGD